MRAASWSGFSHETPTTHGIVREGEMGREFAGSEVMLDREMTKQIVTVRDLARYLHCHQSTIYRLVKRREIPGFRLGGSWRFKIDDIDDWCRRAAVNRGSSRSAHASM